MPIQKTCISCGAEFKVPPCRSSAQYCSIPCIPKKGSDSPRWTGGLILSKCLECGKETRVKKSHAKRGAGKYCSYQCMGIGNGKIHSARAYEKRIIKNCKVCKKEVRIKPSHVDIEGTYCSKICMRCDYKTRLLGDTNPNFRHGKAHLSGFYQETRKNADGFYDKDYPKKLYILQKKKCANCKKSLKGKWHLDHITPIARGGTNWTWNLQILCPHCNCSKNAKDPFIWARENGRLL